MIEPNAPRIDRRQQKTRKLLHDALLALIQEKGYQDITLQDITDKANVARTTFYLHFRDKEDLLFQGMRDMYDDLMSAHVSNIAKMENDESIYMEDAGDFAHVERFADFYRAMTSANGSAAFILNVFDYLAALFQKEGFRPTEAADSDRRVPHEMLAYATAGAEIGTMIWWLHHNRMQIDADRMSKLFYMMAVYGANWATGRDNPNPPEIDSNSGSDLSKTPDPNV